MKTWLAITDEWLAQVDYLTDDDSPMIHSLRACAAQLDKRVTTGLVQQYGITYRWLAKKAGESEEGMDELDRLLSGEQ